MVKRNDVDHPDQWIHHQAILVVAGFFLLLFPEGIFWYAGILLGHWAWFILRSHSTLWKDLGHGLANGTTLIRSLLCFGAVLFQASISAYEAGLLFLCAAALDGIDGWLARRFKGQSYLGATFDEEADALFVLMVTMVVWKSGLTGPWIMVAGLIRYLVKLLYTCFPPPETNAIKTLPWARMVAGLVFLLFPACMMVGNEAGRLIAGLASALVILSFGIELKTRYGH